MQRRGRRSAGRDVLKRAQRLSDDLLRLEADAFARIGQDFAGYVEAVARSVGSAGALRLGGDVGFRRRVVARLAAAGEAATETVKSLCEASFLLSVESILDELRICEETLAARYRGTADAGCAAALQACDGYVEEAVARFEGTLPGLVATTWIAVEEQVRIAALRREDPEVLVRRLCSPTPMNLIGNGGRGVLWRFPSGCQLEARTVSIDVSNVAREAAMIGMNLAGAQVDA